MSDTPRTDAAIHMRFDGVCWVKGIEVHFARELERDLAQRTDERDTFAAEIDLLRARLAWRTAERDALAAEVAALKAQADPINDAVEEACGELPEGWSVGIDLERGAATVYVFDPEGESEMVHEDETSVADLIRAAIRKAKEAKP